MRFLRNQKYMGSKLQVENFFFHIEYCEYQNSSNLNLLMNKLSIGEFDLPTILHSLVESRKEHIHSGSLTQNPVIYPLYASCFTCNDHSKRIKCAEIISARLNIFFKVLCCVDKVHLKRRKPFKTYATINLYSSDQTCWYHLNADICKQKRDAHFYPQCFSHSIWPKQFPFVCL